MLRSRRGTESTASLGPRGGWEISELSTALVVFWLLSLVEAIMPLARHEAYDAQASLAILVVLGVPYLLFDRLRRPWRERALSAPRPGR